MKEFLLEKWNEEIEEWNSQTNLKQLIVQREAQKKKPKIFQQNENKKPKMEKKYVVGKQKKKGRRSVNLSKLLFKKGLRKSSGELNTHVLQEPRKNVQNQIETNKTSKPQEIKINLKRRAPNMSQKATPEKKSQNNLELSQNKSKRFLKEERPQIIFGKTESDIRESKSIHPPVEYNTQEELDLLNRFYEEQEDAAESEIRSMLRRKNNTLINDFTQIKDPFQPQKDLENTEREENQPYDLQIENVVMSEDELHDEDQKLKDIRREKSGVLGGILDINVDVSKKHKANFQPLMKLLGIRKPKYITNGKIDERHSFETEMFKENSVLKSRSVSIKKRHKKKLGTKPITLERLVPTKDKSIEKISKKLNNIEKKKFEEKVMIEHKKFHNVPPSNTSLRKTFAPKIKNTTTKKNYLTKNKKNLKSNKKPGYKNFFGGKKSKQLFESPEKARPKRQLKSSIDKQARGERWSRERNKRKLVRADSRDQFYADIRSSLDKLSCHMNSVDKKEKQREKKNLPPRRVNYHKGSVDSIDKSSRKNGYQMHHMQSSVEDVEESNFINAYVSKNDNNYQKIKLNQTHEVFSNLNEVKKPSFNTGKLRNFLANFNIMDNMEKSMLSKSREEENNEVQARPKLQKMLTKPIYKPSLNNKKLDYLTSNARKPSTKQRPSKQAPSFRIKAKSALIDKNSFMKSTIPEKEEFLQSGIPLSVSQSGNDQSDYSMSGIKDSQANQFGNLQEYEMDNLRNNYSSFPDRYSSNKSQNPWNPIIEVDMEAQKEKRKKPPSNVKINLLKNRKKKLMKRLSVKVDRGLINRFLREIFEKFKKEESVNQNDIEKLNQKFFKHFDKNQRRLMPSIYQLIDVEIAIQSNEFSQRS